MKTYPIYSLDCDQIAAFEVENAYIGIATIAQLLTKVDGVTEIQPRTMFAKSNGIHIEFNYLSRPYVVWEPYGDNSRYWIGPKDQIAGAADIAAIENVFKRYSLPLYRIIIGDLLTLRFLKK